MILGKKNLALLLCVLIGIAALAGLFFYQPGQQKAEADTAVAEQESGPFELVDLANRDLEGAPALALTFSHALDPRHDYNTYIRVFEMPARPGDQARSEEENEGEEPSGTQDANRASTAAQDTNSEGGQAVKGAWVVGENPRLLFFPHVKPNTRYVVQVSHGLPDHAGQTLQAEHRYGIRTAFVAPAYYFASRGMVLPARQNGGLPVITVNIPEVDIQFLRVKPDQLPRFMEKVIAGKANSSADTEAEDEYDYERSDLKGAVGSWQLDRVHTLTESVYTGRFLTEQKANRRNVTFIPVEEIKELREPGIYVAVMSQPNRFRYDYQVTYFYVSDLGLHARLFEKGADVFVNSLETGRAINDVEISWLDAQGKVMDHARTQGEGHAVFAERPQAAKLVMARKDQQISVIALKEPALDLSEFNVVGLPGRAVSLFAYSGRDLYRPGEAFDLSVLIRDADGHPVPSQPVQATLKRPDGKMHFSSVWQPRNGFSGYYQHKIELPPDAPTGFWTLELRSDPADKLPGTSYRFSVEEFLPERMKLELTSALPVLSGQQTFEIGVQGSYLYGAPAAGNRLLGVVYSERKKNPLPEALPGFEFGDVADDSVRSRVELDEQTLDEQGKTTVRADLEPARGHASPFSVRATLSLLESGGRPVIRSIERVYWPAPALVGIRPLFGGDYIQEDSLAEFEVVLADQAAKLKSATLPVRLFRENRNYYWRFDDQRGWNSGYTVTDELVATRMVTLPENGRGKLALPVKYGRYRLEISDPETGKHLRFRFYAGWSAKAAETQGLRPDRVGLKLDKPAYVAGETARLSITPPHGGEALVTVETDRVLWQKRIRVAKEGATLDIPVDKSWNRHDLYINVMVLRPGSEGERITPARALGLVHLPLERTNRKLEVGLETPKKILPDTSLKVKVRVPQAKGKKAMVTLSAVDVGILNITSFVTPDPHGRFFGRLRYGADLYDIYGRLIEKMAGQKGRLKFGGDAAGVARKTPPKKVKLVDLFSGPVALNDQGEAEISLAVPDFNGTLRLMAVVATEDSFGSAEQEVLVAAPLIAELSMPRFLTVGDSAVIALDLHNLSGRHQNLQLSLHNTGGLQIRDAERSLSLKDQQKLTLRFPVETGSAFGLVPLRIKVSGDQLKLDREAALEVLAPAPRQRVLRRHILAPGEQVELKEPELAGLIAGSLESHVSISDMPPVDVRSAIQGLVAYPYGCAEQTTSRAYPYLFLDEAEARAFGLKPYTRAERTEILDKAMARLSAMQAPNGGFSLWGNVSEYEYWLSAYVTNLMVDSREQGFLVPEKMEEKASAFLLKALQEGVASLPEGPLVYDPKKMWRDLRYSGGGRFGALAYGAYVLARESKAPLSTLRQMYDLRAQSHSGLALVQLGLALKMMGDEKRGMAAIQEGLKKPRYNNSWWGDYGSPLRDNALAYVLLHRHKVEVSGRENLLAGISATLEQQRHTSTQEKMALFLLGRNMMADSREAPWALDVQKQGAKQSLKQKGGYVQPLEASSLVQGVTLVNSGERKLFLELSLSGFPTRMPAARSDLVSLERNMYDSQGRLLANRPLQVGETVLVKISVTPKVDIANALVIDRIPAGIEIENLNIIQGEDASSIMAGGVDVAEAMNDSRIQHVEYRDDRFVAAVRIQSPIQLFYRARVVTPGRFVVPPLYLEDMYRPEIYGLTAGGGGLTVIDSRSAKP